MSKIKNRNTMIETWCEEAINGKETADNILESGANGYMTELIDVCSDVSEDDSAILAAVFRKMSEHFEEKFRKKHGNDSTFAGDTVSKVYRLIQRRLMPNKDVVR